MKARSALPSTTPQCIRAMTRAARENATSTTVNIEGNACAAGVFVMCAFNECCSIDVTTTHRRQLKARRTDSESRILAIKKFSCLAASRLIGARQNRIFARIARS
jgi:hypothetical protein